MAEVLTDGEVIWLLRVCWSSGTAGGRKEDLERIGASHRELRVRLERAEGERDEAADARVSLTNRMNEREAEHYQQSQDATKAALEWGTLVEKLRGNLEEAFRRLGPAEQAARKETERADLLFVQKNKLTAELAEVQAERDAALLRAEGALFNARIIVTAEIVRATGPDGGWTVSPVQLSEAIAAALGPAGERGEE